MSAKLTRWFIFSVLIALLPIGFTYVHLVTDEKPASIAILLAHGELLLISVALAADAVGDLIAGGTEKAVRKIISGGGCVITVIFASFYFADVSSRAQVNTGIVFEVSIAIFIFTLVASASCKYLAEEAKNR